MCCAGEKRSDNHKIITTILNYICITIELSLSLNDLLWIILVAPMDIYNKMDTVAFFYSRAKVKMRPNKMNFFKYYFNSFMTEAVII